jgi:hypothetical protein
MIVMNVSDAYMFPISMIKANAGLNTHKQLISDDTEVTIKFTVVSQDQYFTVNKRIPY